MKSGSFAILAIGIGIGAFPTASDSCSIAPPVPVFSTSHRPADVQGFAQGKIGVIRPSYQRRYLIGAYRIVSGKPLSEKEAEALYFGSSPAAPVPNVSAPQAWMQIRAKAGITGPPFLNTYRTKTGNGLFLNYPNCLGDAFDAAVQTYQKRAMLWGDNDPRLREWVTAQDQVFANCSGQTAVIPTAPDAGMDPLLASDRRYQIAAAYFYAADWQKARDAFDEVAHDQSSPWKGIARYLIARTYIREGTVDEEPDALQQAERQLQSIMADPAQQAWHEPSSKLLDYVGLRIDPGPRLAELGAELTGAKPSIDVAQSASDFLYLYGHNPAGLPASSDLADWMLTFEGHNAGTEPHAVAQWKTTHNPAWLLAALVHGSDAEAIRAARATSPNAPEYESVTYYGILADPDRQEARAWADEALGRQLLLSTRNLILSERLSLARDWTEFLRFAPRATEPKLESYNGSEQDAGKPPVATGTLPLLDRDATTALNQSAPFALWKDAANNPLLPAHLQVQIAEAAWVRALVLGKDEDAQALMKRVVALRPESGSAARDFLSASDADTARFSGVFLLLRTPNLGSFVYPGEDAADLTKVSHLGSLHWGFTGGCLPYNELPPARPAFLDVRQAENTAEWKQMAAAAPSGGEYLAEQVMAWAGRHPDDPRLPEALHLVVQAGRRACSDRQRPVDYGRRAFALLHRRYPKSEWAQKTKYWYQ